jgi:proline dehydrogenase
MLAAASKLFFHTLARSHALKNAASRYAMASRAGLARQFIAGETIDDAIGVVQAIEARGMSHTLDYLGESATTLAEADNATRTYLAIMETVVRAGIGRHLSLKLTQLGLDVDPASCVDNLRRILGSADRHGFFVAIDMEGSPYTAATLDIFETLWKQGYRRVGTVLQSALRRSEADLQRLLALGATVRIVKGAYREPKSIAFQTSEEVRAAFLRMATAALTQRVFCAIATHDEALIREVRQTAGARGVAPDQFEFEMLYGIRRDLQASLTTAGYQMRIYTPFGREWFPYVMRRLGERPANVWFVVRNLFAGR